MAAAKVLAQVGLASSESRWVRLYRTDALAVARKRFPLFRTVRLSTYMELFTSSSFNVAGFKQGRQAQLRQRHVWEPSSLRLAKLRPSQALPEN